MRSEFGDAHSPHEAILHRDGYVVRSKDLDRWVVSNVAGRKGLNYNMPVSPEAKVRILDALRAARPIESKAMFGGLRLYLDGVFMAVVDDDRLYLKVDPLTEPEYVARGMDVWSVSPKAYRELPQDVLDDPEACGQWLDASRDAAIRRKAKPRKPSPREA